MEPRPESAVDAAVVGTGSKSYSGSCISKEKRPRSGVVSLLAERGATSTYVESTTARALLPAPPVRWGATLVCGC